ncbi:MAG: DUF6348 family protein [Pirellulales bacterium]|nr:DUF6348 family protein [Pirellulales bacterium]
MTGKMLATIGGSRAVLAMLAAGLVLLGGCSRLTTEYGKSKGASGRRSLNGFGALRTTYQQAGFRDRDVTRLSDRVKQQDVIVWTPQMLKPVSTKVTRWFDRWLRQGDHTLVYILPDSGSETDYWMEAGKLAPPPQRLEYRKRAARSVNERMTWRLNRSGVTSNGWFAIEPLLRRAPLGELSGPWSETLGQDAAQADDIEYELTIKLFDETAAAPAAAGVLAGPTGPGAGAFPFFIDETTQTKTPVSFHSVLRSGSDEVIIAEIRSEQWRNSKIIVVAGGSLLTNYAFTREFNRGLAEKIVSESTPQHDRTRLAGFLTSNWNAIPVSERKPGVPKASGMELLTVWPISLVTTHGVMLGLVICLMLLPIFGRPKRVLRAHQNDFGDHLDAVAALMNKSGGVDYARARISEYMKRIRGETSGKWVLPDPEPSLAGASLPGAATKHFSTHPDSKQTPSSGIDGGTDSGSLLDLALNTDSLGESDDSESQAGEDLPETPFEVFEQSVAQRLIAQGLEPSVIQRGVVLPSMRILRTENNLMRLAVDSVSGRISVAIAIEHPKRGEFDLSDSLVLFGSDPQEALESAATTFVEVTFPAIHALLDDQAANWTRAGVFSLPARGPNPGIKWEVFTGKRQLSENGIYPLDEPNPLKLVRKTLQAVLLDGSLHYCCISASSNGTGRLELECYLDGQRSNDAEEEIRGQWVGRRQDQQVWRFRQFFVLRLLEPSVSENGPPS